MGKILYVFLAFFLLIPAGAGAQTAAPEAAGTVVPGGDGGGKTSSGLPIPRFVTLAAEQVFVRTGPALRYPIKWVYRKEALPVEIIQEFDTWRKIRDMDGDSGWIHQSLLSGERSVIVKGEANLAVRKDAAEDSGIIVYLEPNVVAAALSCHQEWCEVESEGYTGWAQRKFLWGIYDSEDFD